MSNDEAPQRDSRVEAALWNIRIDAATAEVVEAFSHAGIDSVLLKGPALADWYPEDWARTYVDGDLWVAPSDAVRAEEVLRSLGFTAKVDERGLPDWWQEHASSWLREADRGSVDLHRKLQGVRAEPARVWERLWAESEPLDLAGRAARRLSPAARALYATLHATHHGVRDARGLPHLAAALSALDDSVWRGAADLAEDLDALEAFSTGLRLVPEGAALAERIGVPQVTSVRATLHAVTPPPVALGFDQLATARGIRRFEILLRKFFPPPGFIRHWWQPAERNRLLLAVGYAYRPIWLLRHAPAGWRAWRQARRTVHEGSDHESRSDPSCDVGRCLPDARRLPETKEGNLPAMPGTTKTMSYTGPRADVLGMLTRIPQRSLDIGCSNGAFSKRLTEAGTETWGIESDPVFGEQAKMLLGHVLIGDAEVLTDHLVDSGDQFDAVICADVLEHTVDPWSVMANVRKLVAPEGEVIVSLPNVRFFTTIVWLVGKGRWRYEDRGVHDRTHLRCFTDANARDMFSAAGFVVDEVLERHRITDSPGHRWRRIAASLSAKALGPLRAFVVYQYIYRLRPV